MELGAWLRFRNIPVQYVNIKVIYGVLKDILKESIKILIVKKLYHLNLTMKQLEFNMDPIQEKHNLYPYKSIIEL